MSHGMDARGEAAQIGLQHGGGIVGESARHRQHFPARDRGDANVWRLRTAHVACFAAGSALCWMLTGAALDWLASGLGRQWLLWSGLAMLLALALAARHWRWRSCCLAFLLGLGWTLSVVLPERADRWPESRSGERMLAEVEFLELPLTEK